MNKDILHVCCDSIKFIASVYKNMLQNCYYIMKIRVVPWTASSPHAAIMNDPSKCERGYFHQCNKLGLTTNYLLPEFWLAYLFFIWNQVHGKKLCLNGKRHNVQKFDFYCLILFVTHENWWGEPAHFHLCLHHTYVESKENLCLFFIALTITIKVILFGY